jgi:hypothetical protein
VYSSGRDVQSYYPCVCVLLFIRLYIQHFNYSIRQLVLQSEFRVEHCMLFKISSRNSYNRPRVRAVKSILTINKTNVRCSECDALSLVKSLPNIRRNVSSSSTTQASSAFHIYLKSMNMRATHFFETWTPTCLATLSHTPD